MNRALMREKIFANPDEKRWLEALLHPLIREEIVAGLENASSPYALLVSPLLVEAGQNALTQRVLVVDVPEELQLSRTMSRDSNSADQVRAIMASQASREQRLGYADDVIVNDSSLEALQQKVEELHQSYLWMVKEEGIQ
jgi:dephospho-CoA kinase